MAPNVHPTTLPCEHATVPKPIRNMFGSAESPRSRLERQATEQARAAEIGYVRKWVDTTRASMVLRIINWGIAIGVIVFASLFIYRRHPSTPPLWLREKIWVLFYGIQLLLNSMIPLCVVGYSHPKKRRAMWITWAIVDALSATAGVFVILYLLRNSLNQQFSATLLGHAVASSTLSAVNSVLDSVQATRLLKY